MQPPGPQPQTGQQQSSPLLGPFTAGHREAAGITSLEAQLQCDAKQELVPHTGDTQPAALDHAGAASLQRSNHAVQDEVAQTAQAVAEMTKDAHSSAEDQRCADQQQTQESTSQHQGATPAGTLLSQDAQQQQQQQQPPSPESIGLQDHLEASAWAQEGQQQTDMLHQKVQPFMLAVCCFCV